jgi:hypothetical protein
MRHEVSELARFPREGALQIPVALIKRLSPDSLSVMEFKSPRDIAIAEKMLAYPLLGEAVEDKWQLRLTREFDMTNDSGLFHTSPGRGRLPLYEGKMIWQFDHQYAEPRYWVDEREARAALLGRTPDRGQKMDYQTLRLGFRDIASSTNERTMVSAMIPPTFHGNKIPTVCIYDQDGKTSIRGIEQLFLCAIWNSFTMDYVVRMKVSATLNFFIIYQLPVPRLMEGDAAFRPIVQRAARLICTAPEFDALAREAGLRDWRDGATNPAERAHLRAELDALVARLYNLTEEEFTHVLSAFPLVKEEVKAATLEEFRRL